MSSIEISYRHMIETAHRDQTKISGKFFIDPSISRSTLENKQFRQILFTGPTIQLVLMSIDPLQEIGEEIHENIDQFIRIESGHCAFIINGERHETFSGSAVVIPKGTKHNVVNLSSSAPLKLYAIYSPPEHDDPNRIVAEEFLTGVIPVYNKNSYYSIFVNPSKSELLELRKDGTLVRFIAQNNQLYVFSAELLHDSARIGIEKELGKKLNTNNFEGIAKNLGNGQLEFYDTNMKIIPDPKTLASTHPVLQRYFT